MLEILLACVICAVVSGGIYAIVQAGTVVSAKALAGSSSSTANRLAMDRMIQSIQLSYNMPTLINHNGVSVSGTGPAQGIRFQRYMGGPYVVTIPPGGLQFNAVTMTVTAATASSSTNDKISFTPPPAPEQNDILVINTTAMASGADTQVMAYIASVSSNTTGGRTSYTLGLSQALDTTITADTGATVTAILVRPTAFVVRPTADGRELRMVELYPTLAVSGTVDTNRNHTTMTPQIALLATGTNDRPAIDEMDDDEARPFTLTTNNGRTFVKIALGVRASNYDNYLEDKQANSLDTYVKTETIIALKCNPNQ